MSAQESSLPIWDGISGIGLAVIDWIPASAEGQGRKSDGRFARAERPGLEREEFRAQAIAGRGIDQGRLRARENAQHFVRFTCRSRRETKGFIPVGWDSDCPLSTRLRRRALLRLRAEARRDIQ